MTRGNTKDLLNSMIPSEQSTHIDVRHAWKLESAGVWESYYSCRACGVRVRENHDDIVDLPQYGCGASLGESNV